ncbi:TOTE conflict system archaeo-eukaryotic primase domain-containing protein [Ureibacillus sp. MALMAid1270]|uniref:TOTE conflict system archaeo-eukaryotic primase domain-containing protein n=1 Tax=Ureibacillus sp. MALMAid1270 TaxID=3411629 RepID=UPI003BA802DA
MDNLKYQLQKALQECNRLKQENMQLRAILHLNNISLSSPSTLKSNELVKSKTQKIQERIQIFNELFKGRTDVYAKRYETNNGKSGYTPACKFEWQKPICQKPAIKCSECSHRTLLPLTDQVIYDHLVGKHTIGLYPLLQNEKSWFLAVDFDKKSWQQDVQAFISTCRELQVPASIERSRSGNGAHVWIFMQKATSASLIRKLGHVLLTRTLSKRYELGMDSFDRMFPNQDTLPKGGFGNLIGLPLQKEPRKNGNSIFVDHNFVPYPNQWEYLKGIQKIPEEKIQEIVHYFYKNNEKVKPPVESAIGIPTIINMPKRITVIEKNGLIINKENHPSNLIQKLIELATFNNPEFYKAQAKRNATYGIPRVISCSDECNQFIVLPRGCKENLIKLLNDLSIEVDFQDATNQGLPFSVDFIGKLRTEQEEAVSQLMQNPTGILSATTGFGKTVIAASLIAKRKTSTLILVNRKQLIDQWKEKLSTFLDLKEQEIGQIGGGKNKPTGIIDVATVQSLNYKGEIKDLVTQYGQVIVDECHHISAFSFEKVLKKVEAKYILGLTATPTRKDGLQPIMNMQLGPIRYKVSAKSKKSNQPYDYILSPKFTNFKSRLEEKEMNIQSLYKELVNNHSRNEMIFNDVLQALEEGSTPLILTERVEHAHTLASKFKGFAKNIFLLTGKMKEKERQELLNKLKNLKDDEERLIIATGKYIGEGFDHSKLDILFLTMPISWKGTLQQYVGRLHRLHEHKSVVKVIDYVDHKVGLFNGMFEKRLKGYRSMGYRVLEEKNHDAIDGQMKLF